MPLKVLITGANSGFGLLTAKTFAQAGHTVFASLRNPAKSKPLDDLKSAGLPVQVVRLDVTDPSSVEAAVKTASADGPLDVLVNNAGFSIRGPVEALTDAELHRQFDTNVYGVIRTIRAVAPQMREAGRGTIVNVSSVAGHLAPPYETPYSATKHAVEAISEGLWYELRPFGVRVVLIAPGFFPTDFGANVVTAEAFGPASPHAANAERFSKALEGMNAGSAPDPQEVADLIVQAAQDPDPKLRYLAGDDARMLVPLYRSMEFEPFVTTMVNQLNLADMIPPPKG